MKATVACLVFLFSLALISAQVGLLLGCSAAQALISPRSEQTPIVLVVCRTAPI
jgi:hypothetical protein